MSAYLGYYTPTAGYIEENNARARAQGAGIDPKFRQMVIDLPQKLPSGCKLIGSYSPMQVGGLPSIMILETSNTDDLTFISQYYAGYLQFQWAPARAIGATSGERERATAALAAPAGVR